MPNFVNQYSTCVASFLKTEPALGMGSPVLNRSNNRYKITPCTTSPIVHRSNNRYKITPCTRTPALDRRQQVVSWLNNVDFNIISVRKQREPLNDYKTGLTSDVKTNNCYNYYDCHADNPYTITDIKIHKSDGMCPTKLSVENQRDKTLVMTDSVEPIENGFTTDIGHNACNSLNHDIHQCLWCPCLLYFVFLFCIPAVYLMQRSDRSFKESDVKSSSRFALAATVCFVLGFVFTILFYTGIGCVVYWSF